MGETKIRFRNSISLSVKGENSLLAKFYSPFSINIDSDCDKNVPCAKLSFPLVLSGQPAMLSGGESRQRILDSR